MLDMFQWQDLLVAVGLVLIIEGFMPFISPKSWRTLLAQVLTMNDQGLRIMGLVSMVMGVIILSAVK